MRRILVWAVLAGAVFVVLRILMGSAGSASLAQRVAERCERMMASMPASFPPKRMMADLGAIEEGTVRILELLEERTEEPRQSGHAA